MANDLYVVRYALRHKRDHILFPDPAQPNGAPLSFPSYDEALAHRSTMFNAHQWRVVKFDPASGQYV